MEEVMRYALVASAIARQHTFDVIHAHDWLTNMAGIAAKRVSGNRLSFMYTPRVRQNKGRR